MTVGITTSAEHHLTFVRGNNGTADYEHLFTNDGISFNPNIGSGVGRLTVEDLATTGNAADFGDTSQATNAWDGSSDSHGGLGGF